MSEKRQQRWFIVLYLMIVGTLIVMSKSIQSSQYKNDTSRIIYMNIKYKV